MKSKCSQRKCNIIYSINFLKHLLTPLWFHYEYWFRAKWFRLQWILCHSFKCNTHRLECKASKNVRPRNFLHLQTEICSWNWKICGKKIISALEDGKYVQTKQFSLEKNLLSFMHKTEQSAALQVWHKSQPISDMDMTVNGDKSEILPISF